MSHTSRSPEGATSARLNAPSSNSLKSRHLVMMALGSAIGTGLFVGTGSAIKAAGPAVIISYFAGCLLLVLVMRALGEMSAADPAPGSFSTYAGKAMGPTAGRALGWLWWIQIVIVIAAESTAAEIRSKGRRAITIQGDVGNPADNVAAVEATIAELGPIRYLVANAANGSRVATCSGAKRPDCAGMRSNTERKLA